MKLRRPQKPSTSQLPSSPGSSAGSGFRSNPSWEGTPSPQQRSSREGNGNSDVSVHNSATPDVDADESDWSIGRRRAVIPSVRRFRVPVQDQPPPSPSPSVRSNASWRRIMSHRQSMSPTVPRSLGSVSDFSREGSVVSSTGRRPEGSVVRSEGRRSEGSVVSSTGRRSEGSIVSSPGRRPEGGPSRPVEREESRGEHLDSWIVQRRRRARERSATVERPARRDDDLTSSSSSSGSSPSNINSRINEEPVVEETPSERAEPADGPGREPSGRNRPTPSGRNRPTPSCRNPRRQPNRVSRPSAPSRRKARTPRRNVPKVIREIKRLQSSTDMLIPKLPFQRLVRETAYRITGQRDLRFQGFGLQALQEAAEAYMIQMFENAYLCTLHARRVTIRPNDMILVQRILASVDLSRY